MLLPFCMTKIAQATIMLSDYVGIEQISHIKMPYDLLCAIDTTAFSPENVNNFWTISQRLRLMNSVLKLLTAWTRQRASTSMYSLTFCVRFLLPERHHWKPAVQSAAVMLRTPPVDGQSPASQPRALAIYGAQCWERLRHLLVTN